MALDHLIARHVREINGSGIRRVFDEAAATPGAVRLYIGQPDFPIDPSITKAAADAILAGTAAGNGYSATQGVPELLAAVRKHVLWDLGWTVDDRTIGAMATSGTSGGLMLACMAVLDPGDELIIPDPWFVLYPYLAKLTHAHAVRCDTYPDFRMTVERVERLITPRTKAVLVCSPGNPAGVVNTQAEQRELLELCRRKNILLISDEIYDEFTFSESLTAKAAGDGTTPRCPSPGREPNAHEHALIIRGFGKTYGVTGWRLGYAVGPQAILAEMRKLQQYLYVCPPTPLQRGAVGAFSVDMTGPLSAYRARRDRVLAALAPLTDVPTPGGAFYAFVQVPKRLGMTGEEFYQHAKTQKKVFVVPGRTFSAHDTHFRLSYATDEHSLEVGLAALVDLMKA